MFAPYDTSKAVPFDKNSENEAYSFIEVKNMRELAVSTRKSTSNRKTTTITRYYYLAQGIDDSFYVIQMVKKSRGDEFIADMKANPDKKVILYGTGGTAVPAGIVEMFSGNKNTISKSGTNFQRRNTMSPFKNADEFYNGWGKRMFREDQTPEELVYIAIFGISTLGLFIFGILFIVTNYRKNNQPV
jgi:hypothetical protein